LTGSERIAYVGVVSLTIRDRLAQYALPDPKSLKRALQTGSKKPVAIRKEMRGAHQSATLWGRKIMARLYYHMDIDAHEQRMIESLGNPEHGVRVEDWLGV
jgi:hypothetical protein